VNADSVGTDAVASHEGLESSLESSPAALKNHEYAWATYRLRNTGTAKVTVYFRPSPNATESRSDATGSHLMFHFTLVDRKRSLSHYVAAIVPEIFEVPEDGHAKLGRIAILPGGLAWFQLRWCAQRTSGGHAPRLTPISHDPLEAGSYRLSIQTPEPKLDPKDAPVALLAGGERDDSCHWPNMESDELFGEDPRGPSPAAPEP